MRGLSVRYAGLRATDSPAKLCTVFSRSERRRHLEVGIVAFEIVAGKKQMVRCCFRSYRKALFLRTANELNTFRSGDMLHVQAASGLAAK